VEADFRAEPLHRKLVLQAAVSALRIPLRMNCIDALLGAMSDMDRLATIDSQLFAIASNLTGRFGVLYHFNGDIAQQQSRYLAPSYFVNWPTTIEALSQVHIPDCKIGTLGNCHLVTFTSAPDDVQIAKVESLLWNKLHAASCRSISTKAFMHSPAYPVFNMDGSLCRATLDTILSPAAKSALSKVAASGQDRQVAFALGKSRREPRTVVIWIRQSAEDTAAKTSVPRQAWSALTGKAPPLQDLRSDDRLVIAIEYCSSSQHPWHDRNIRDLIPTDRSLHVITSNPDRLTRRPSEVDEPLAELGDGQGSWWSQGAKFDGGNESDWIDVRKHADKVVEQIRCGKYRSATCSWNTLITNVE
jgi:hypothetical protein